MELIKEVKISGTKKTEYGPVPNDWLYGDVETFFEIHNQNRLPISEKVREKMNGPFPYYGPTKIQDYINEYRYEGTFALIGEDGDHFLKWDKMKMTQLAKGKFNVNNHAHAIKGTALAITEWFYFFFAHRDITPYLTRQGAGRYKLTKAALKKIPCVVPPTLAEQKVIIKALSEVDELISSLDELIEKKKAFKQGAMQQLLTPPQKGGKRLPGFEGEWEEKRLGDLFEITSSKRVFQSEWTNAGIPFYRARELAILSEKDQVNNDLFITEDMYNKYKIQYGVPEVGDILVTGVGTLGKVYVVRNNKPFYFKDGNIIWFKVKGSVNSDFLEQLYKTPFIQKQIEDSSSGTTVGTYTITGANKTVIPFPPIKEQDEIASILKRMDESINSIIHKKLKYQQIKQGMMQDLLTGKIRLL